MWPIVGLDSRAPLVTKDILVKTANTEWKTYFCKESHGEKNTGAMHILSKAHDKLYSKCGASRTAVSGYLRRFPRGGRYHPPHHASQ